MKILANYYTTYGKGDNAELTESLLIEDTQEGRQMLLEDYSSSYDDTYEDRQEFISGKINEITFSTDGGDWDDPTGYYFELLTKEQALAQADKLYKTSVSEINEKFEGNSVGKNGLSIPKHLANNLLEYPDFLQTEEDIDQFMFDMYDTYEAEQYATYDEIKAYLNPITRQYVTIMEDEK